SAAWLHGCKDEGGRMKDEPRPPSSSFILHPSSFSCPAVAVLALFPAQARLLQLLVSRSAVIAAAAVPVAEGLPAALAHRECFLALVSLTRSHTHRAVPFSDPPRALVLAFTRAVARLVLFGDPGTLTRRSQWHGALDHLDELAGRLEQAL